MSEHEHAQGADYEHVDTQYLEERQLQKGSAGWLQLAGLGVAIVISGDFAGWNYGLALGGWGGMLVAAMLMAIMYLCLTLTLSELASAMPSAGGFYTFVRRAFGPFGGYVAGIAVAMATVTAAGAIAVFIGAYFEVVFGFGGWPVQLAFFLVFIGIHSWGVGEALGLILVITLIAIVTLGTFVVYMLPYFSTDNLFNIPVSQVDGASRFLPFGYFGVWSCIPFAIWLFIGIEHVSLASEEAKDPAKSIPKGMISAILVLFFLAVAILFVGPGGGGAKEIMEAEDPLLTAISSPNAYGSETAVALGIGLVALSGLIASFFSVMYAYSRQIFALSRAGYLPRFLSITNSRHSPFVALAIPGIFAFALSQTNPEYLVLTAVFLLTLTYILVQITHIYLRRSEPHMERPYRTPGGVMTSSVGMILAIVAATACFLVETGVIYAVLVLYALFLAYYIFYSRHHLVAEAPGEEENIHA